MRVIGFLGSSSSGAEELKVAAFRGGLGETGYVEGQNVATEYRWAEGSWDRLPAFAADIVARKGRRDRGLRRPYGTRGEIRDFHNPDRLPGWRRPGPRPWLCSKSGPARWFPGQRILHAEWSLRVSKRCAIPRWRRIGSKVLEGLREPAALSSMIAERIEESKANDRKDYQRARARRHRSGSSRVDPAAVHQHGTRRSGR
jgi:hypothetical protein